MTLPDPQPSHLLAEAKEHLREGRFQRSLSLVAGSSSALGGLEVLYEHYRGGYGQKIMWTPVALSAAMTVAGLTGSQNKWAARTLLRWVSIVTLLDSAAGFYFHIRGIARKPGGWRLPLVNIVMGPPLFAPLLFGISAYMGLIASYLRPEDASKVDLSEDTLRRLAELVLYGHGREPWRVALREGRYQKHLAFATALSAFFSGFEAWYSHYKNNFKYKAQWSPVIIAPCLVAAALASMKSRRAARTALPVMSALAVADGAAGFYYHARGVLKRPGGLKLPLYNVMYGPPVFAPLLFAACGVLGILACLMGRERR